MYSDLTDTQALNLLKNVTLPITDWAAKRIEELEASNVRLRVALKDVAVGLECDCDEAYVKRGRHEPNALCYLLPDVLAAISPEESK